MKLTNLLTSDQLRNVSAGILATSLVACGASATPQLVDARRAYDDAAASNAPTRAPGALSEARVALDQAERAHDEQPGSAREVRLSERAERKARYAEARGDERADLSGVRTTRVERIERERAVAPRQERVSRKEANSALQSLAQVANVKEEPRGVVITLSGSLLFPSGEEQISPVATRSLDQVAHALSQQPRDTTFYIEGYTDSSGSHDENRNLSEKRAQEVADRLAESGIDTSRIHVVGRGEAAPIADNDTSEGRAANRRVEIVVDRHSRS